MNAFMLRLRDDIRAESHLLTICGMFAAALTHVILVALVAVELVRAGKSGAAV